jgi:uncharacterized protein (TIGR02246 family)
MGEPMMRLLGRLWFALAVLLPVAAAAQPVFSGSPKDAAAVFEKATAAGDVDAIASLYAPDAVLFGPGGQTIAGREAIRAVHRRNQAAGPNTIRFSEVKIDAGDDRAIMLWGWTSQIAPQGRPPVVTKGRSLVHWKRTAGGWQITMDMFQVLPP